MTTTVTATASIEETVTVVDACDDNYYYVDATSGDDGGDGHYYHPWKTISKVNAAALVAGDVVLFKRGETFVGQLAPVTSGIAGLSITYGAYGTGNRPIIDGSASNNAFYIINSTAHHIRCENIDFAGANSASLGVVHSYTHDMYFYNCVMRDGAVKGGFAAWDTEGTNLYNIVLDTCYIHDNYTNGVLIVSVNHNDGPHDCLITNCVSYNNGHSVYADHGFYVNCGVMIQDCISYNNSSAGYKLNDEFVEGSTYFPVLKDSISYGNYDGICAAHYHAKYYNNLVYSNLSSNILLDGSMNSEFYFNTFVNATDVSDYAIQFSAGTNTGNTFKDNLFIQDEAVIAAANISTPNTMASLIANNTFDYNIYYHSSVNPTTAHLLLCSDGTKDWTEWTGGGAEPNGTLLTAVPDFVTRYTDLHPADGGNLKALGLAITGYELDKDNHTRADPPTSGCYEEAS